jgi:hypothetical protein
MTAMKTKSLAMDTETHITDTGHMDTSSTEPTTTNKLVSISTSCSPISFELDNNGVYTVGR